MSSSSEHTPLTQPQAYYLYDLSIEDIDHRRACRKHFESGRDVMAFLGITTHQQLRDYTELKKKRINGIQMPYYRTYKSAKHNTVFAIRKAKKSL